MSHVDDNDPRHVSFPSDDAPLPDAERLHILGADDYYVAIGSGESWPMKEAVRACTSGARDPAFTMLIAALWKYGKGDLDGARACASTFIEQMDLCGARAEKSAAELTLDEIAVLCGCPQWEYPAQVVRDVKNTVEAFDRATAELQALNARLDKIIPVIESSLAAQESKED